MSERRHEAQLVANLCQSLALSDPPRHLRSQIALPLPQHHRDFRLRSTRASKPKKRKPAPNASQTPAGSQSHELGRSERVCETRAGPSRPGAPRNLAKPWQRRGHLAEARPRGAGGNCWSWNSGSRPGRRAGAGDGDWRRRRSSGPCGSPAADSALAAWADATAHVWYRSVGADA